MAKLQILQFFGVCSFCCNCVALQKTECVGATESKVRIGNFNVKATKTIEHILSKTWHAHNFAKFQQNEHTPEKFDIQLTVFT